MRTRRVSEVMRDPQLLVERFGTSARWWMARSSPRRATFSRTQRSGPMGVSGIGEHAVEVLTSAGLPAEKIKALGDGGGDHHRQAHAAAADAIVQVSRRTYSALSPWGEDVGISPKCRRGEGYA